MPVTHVIRSVVRQPPSTPVAVAGNRFSAARHCPAIVPSTESNQSRGGTSLAVGDSPMKGTDERASLPGLTDGRESERLPACTNGKPDRPTDLTCQTIAKFQDGTRVDRPINTRALLSAASRRAALPESDTPRRGRRKEGEERGGTLSARARARAALEARAVRTRSVSAARRRRG